MVIMQLQISDRSTTTIKLFHLIQFAIYNKYLYYKLLVYMQLALLHPPFAQPTGNIGQKKTNMLHQLEAKPTHNYEALLIKWL